MTRRSLPLIVCGVAALVAIGLAATPVYAEVYYEETEHPIQNLARDWIMENDGGLYDIPNSIAYTTYGLDEVDTIWTSCMDRKFKTAFVSFERNAIGMCYEAILDYAVPDCTDCDPPSNSTQFMLDNLRFAWTHEAAHLILYAIYGEDKSDDPSWVYHQEMVADSFAIMVNDDLVVLSRVLVEFGEPSEPRLHDDRHWQVTCAVLHRLYELGLGEYDAEFLEENCWDLYLYRAMWAVIRTEVPTG